MRSLLRHPAPHYHFDHTSRFCCSTQDAQINFTLSSAFFMLTHIKRLYPVDHIDGNESIFCRYKSDYHYDF